MPKQGTTQAAPLTPGLTGLMNQEQVPLAAFADLPSELAFQLASLRPGDNAVAYVDSNGEVSSIGVGTAIGTYSFTTTAATQTTKPWKLMTFYATVSNLITANGVAGFTEIDLDPPETTTVDFTNHLSATAQARATIWGETANWTNRWYLYGLTAKIILRTPVINLSGSAFIGQISYTQLRAGTTIGGLKKHAFEVDLKTNPMIEVRNFIQNRELVHMSVQNDFLGYQDEMITYVLIPPGPSMFSGAAAEYNMDVSIRGAYVWQPEFDSPALEGVVKEIAVKGTAPNQTQIELSEAMDTLVRAPIPPPRNVFANIVHYAVTGTARKAIMGPRQMNPSTTPLAITNGNVASFEGRMATEGKSLRAWEDFTNWASNTLSEVQNELLPTFSSWLKASALTIGRSLVRVGVEALLKAEDVSIPTMRQDDMSFLLWTERKLQRVLGSADYSPAAMVRYEDLLDAIDDLYAELQNEENWRVRCTNLLSTWTRVYDRRGSSKWLDSEGREVNPREEFEKLRPPSDLIEVEPLPERSRSNTNTERNRSLEQSNSFKEVYVQPILKKR